MPHLAAQIMQLKSYTFDAVMTGDLILNFVFELKQFFLTTDTMKVPLAFQKLAATRGTGADGAVPKDTKIIFAIGGYSYRFAI